VKKSKRAKRLRTKFPEMTLQEIADKIGSTRENVWGVLKRNGLPTASVRTPKPKKRKRVRKWCKICGKMVFPVRNIKNNAAHDGACMFQLKYVKLICEWCRSPFYRRRVVQEARIREGKKNTYCSRDCYKQYRSFHSANK